MKIIIIEDNKEYREVWKKLFEIYRNYLDVEIEIPDEISDIAKLLGRGMADGAHFILGDELGGFKNVSTSGLSLYIAFQHLGYDKKVILCSSGQVDRPKNIRKPSEKYFRENLCDVICLIYNLPKAEWNLLHRMTRDEVKFYFKERNEDMSEDMTGCFNVYMRAWFKERVVLWPENVWCKTGVSNKNNNWIF